MAKFNETFCSSCGSAFGPGDSGFSHCDQHADLCTFIINQIHQSYDPVPSHWQAREAKNWDDGTNDIADAIVERLRSTLRKHWLTHIACDHAAGTDRPSCSCSLWRGPTVNSVGAAVDAWVSHVIKSTINP